VVDRRWGRTKEGVAARQRSCRRPQVVAVGGLADGGDGGVGTWDEEGSEEEEEGEGGPLPMTLGVRVARPPRNDECGV
jgi:hypothetical protein